MNKLIRLYNQNRGLILMIVIVLALIIIIIQVLNSLVKSQKTSKIITNEQINIIKEAIEDHRASSTHKPRSIYGMIVSTADRTIIDIDNSIKRAYSYGKKNFIELSEKEQIERVYQHLKEKYGEKGYAKIYLEDKEFEEALYQLRQALSDKSKFIKRVEKVINEI